MEKTIVIYSSKYGSTKQYALWICDALGCNAVDIDDFSRKDLKNYDNIIYGGAIHAGGIRGFDKFRKWIKSDLKIMKMVSDGTLSAADAAKAGSSAKHIVVFSVGITAATDENIKQLRSINFDKSYLKDLKCFCLRGAYDPSKIQGADKMIMGMVKKMIMGKKTHEKTAAEEDLLRDIENGADYVTRDQIQPILEEFGVREG